MNIIPAMQLGGMHHLTAVTAKATQNLGVYTQTLGMRLVKKTVNQDDTSSYHLFYADARGSPGTDLTFFDWPAVRERRGTRSVVRTGLRVAGEASLRYWADRLGEHGIAHGEIALRDGRGTLDFEDPEGQRLSLIADENRSEAHPWEKSPVPPEHQIRGLGPITISVPELEPTDAVLTELMQLRRVREYESAPSNASLDVASPQATLAHSQSNIHVYEMGQGGPAAELHVAVEPDLPPAHLGAGGVHHVAFRIPDSGDYERWHERLLSFGMRSSGPVDRFYFRSLYFREPAGILFELATDAPGFTADETLEQLGQRLSLPPFLEGRRAEIESRLKPL